MHILQYYFLIWKKVVQPVAVQAPAPIIKFIQQAAPAQPQIIHVVQHHQQQQQQPQVKIIKIVQDNAQSGGWAEPQQQQQHVKIIKIVNEHQQSWWINLTDAILSESEIEQWKSSLKL